MDSTQSSTSNIHGDADADSDEETIMLPSSPYQLNSPKHRHQSVKHPLSSILITSQTRLWSWPSTSSPTHTVSPKTKNKKRKRKEKKVKKGEKKIREVGEENTPKPKNGAARWEWGILCAADVIPSGYPDLPTVPFLGETWAIRHSGILEASQSGVLALVLPSMAAYRKISYTVIHYLYPPSPTFVSGDKSPSERLVFPHTKVEPAEYVRPHQRAFAILAACQTKTYHAWVDVAIPSAQ